METVSGCKLPLSLKVKISRLIDDHCFNCGLSFNMDINSLGNVSKEFQMMCAKLMNHVCTIDVRSKSLVLDLMEAVANADPTIDDGEPSSVHVNPANGGGVNSDFSQDLPSKVCLCVFVSLFFVSTFFFVHINF